MKRVASVLIGVAALVQIATPAWASRSRTYEGEGENATTSVSFTIRKTAGGAFFLKEVDFSVELACEDGTTRDWGAGYGYVGNILALDGRDLVLDNVTSEQALHLTGKFRPATASGTLRFSIAALTEDEQAQLCTTGDLGWTAQRV